MSQAKRQRQLETKVDTCGKLSPNKQANVVEVKKQTNENYI